MREERPDATPAAIHDRARELRDGDMEFARWAAGYGVITHRDATQVRVHELAARLYREGVVPDVHFVLRVLAAADRVASAGMWLVVHMTYARNVRLDGAALAAEDFKEHPEGHTGGALNMVPAYTGYLAANTLAGLTRGWLMGQGHCVAAIEAVNLLVGNLGPAHAGRYVLDDAGLSRFVRDYYGYRVGADGLPESPVGSHVNAHTAGGMMEGGYLGFAELQYAHMPLPGEHLVTFLSDGAFEEQRGSDWVPRWWRAADCGLVTPFMIQNGRRIDQRSATAMKGGADWLCAHLRLNGFDPVLIDGRDPADFAWGIFHMESALGAAGAAVGRGEADYPVPVPYGVAETEKGYGFPGAGTNAAHNLPLGGHPGEDASAREGFNRGARELWVDVTTLGEAVRMLSRHARQGRPLERDHPLAHRQVATPWLPEPPWREPAWQQALSPMAAVDAYFSAIVEANPQLRVRVGNPDEMESNRLAGTLERLRHRVSRPEAGIPEDTHGGVITALNEEAVVSAALANKGGLNLVASYEAFAVRMLGALRQEIIFSRDRRAAGKPPGWLAVPVVATSHTWENGKNAQSHQDPTFCEALMGEMEDVARVLFPADWNSALAALGAAYSAHGEIWTLVTPKGELPGRLDAAAARELAANGAVRVRGSGGANEHLLLAATGAYQLAEALKASDRLESAGVEHAVVYIQEPGRFRRARDEREAAVLAPATLRAALFPPQATVRVFLTHTRPEPFAGTVRPLLGHVPPSPVLGYLNRGGTLDVGGMLMANRCTWAHVVAEAATGLGHAPGDFLSAEELGAVEGRIEPFAL